MLAVRQPDGFALVDETGTSYLAVATLPDDVAVADVDLTNAALLSRAGVVATALPPSLRGKVASIQATNADSIRLALKDGDQVFWGSPDESDLKAQVLSALLKQDARTYDVSAPRNPAVR